MKGKMLESCAVSVRGWQGGSGLPEDKEGGNPCRSTSLLFFLLSYLTSASFPCPIPITALFEPLLQDNWISSLPSFFPLVSSPTLCTWAFLWNQFGVPVETSGWISVLLLTLPPICWLDDPEPITWLFRDSDFPIWKMGLLTYLKQL